MPRILAVDDHELLLENLSRFLSKLAPTDVARTRAEVVALLERGVAYEVAVVDLTLHRDDGIDLTEHLLQAFPGSLRSVVFHTGRTPLPPVPLAVPVPHVIVAKGDLVGLRSAVMARLGGW